MATSDVTRIASNIGALNALNSLTNINTELAIHQTRLATGKRLNEAADDPAGMNIATTFDVRRNALKTVLSSIGDAKNLLSTAEGGLKKIQDIMVKMRNKALEAVGDTIGTSERDAISSQLKAYGDEIDAIVDQTSWNNVDLIGKASSAGGGASASKNFLTDVNGNASTSFVLANGFTTKAGDLNLIVGTGAGNTVDVSSSSTAKTAVGNMDTALNLVKTGISTIGSLTARMNFKEESLTVQRTNAEAAYSRIMNANMAEEQVEASKNMILQQTSTAMLSQANSAPQFLLSLFR